MVVKQNDYISFYNDILDALSNIIYRERDCYLLPQRASYGRMCCAPTPSWPTSCEPIDEKISLSEYTFGEYIDRNYKEKFISVTHRMKSETSTEEVRKLVKTVAEEIYNHKIKLSR